MLKEHLLILKNIQRLQLEQLQCKLNYFIKKYKNNINQLKKLFLYYKKYKNMLYIKLKLGLDALTLNIHYTYLETIEKKILLYNTIINQNSRNIENERNILTILYKKLKIWTILYNRIIVFKIKNKNYLLNRHLNQYYQLLALKNIFYNKY